MGRASSRLHPESANRGPSQTIRILFLNSHGGGFADHLDVPVGTTIAGLLARQLPQVKAEDLLIRVNRQPVPADHVLQDGDRVSATATKIEGAAIA